MTAVDLTAFEMHGEWTTDDLDTLPESHRHHELIDGILIESPAAGSLHQVIIGHLYMLLHQSCPPDYVVTQDVEVRLSRSRALVPDISAVTTAAMASYPLRFSPQDLLLAVEVVSPSSVTMDRFTKPALYAQAGIPFYWIVETNPEILVRTFRLDPAAQVYQPTGEFADAVRVEEPWPIEFGIDELVPKFP